MTVTTTRDAGLRQVLIARRRDMLDGVQSRSRDRRTDRPIEVRDDLEHTNADIQEDIEAALLQIRAETLVRIDDALRRLAARTYGTCVECESDISERRLRALPFAVRCQACEARREQAQRHARQRTQQRGGLSLFSDAAGP